MALVEGNITRNMKKLGNLANNAFGVTSKAGEVVKKELVPSKKGLHACAYDPKGGAGALFTSKKQESSTDALLLKNEKMSFAYLQLFDKSNKAVSLELIENENLKKLLVSEGVQMAVKANLILKNVDKGVIKLNINNSQKWVEITENNKNCAKNFIEFCGGEEKVNEMLSFQNFYQETIKNAQWLIIKLANADNKTKTALLMQHKQTYENLKILDKEKLENIERSLEVQSLLEKIEELLS